ncbi:vitamin B12-dependent ribonucleotide reductase [Candidatus Microgenomates bacterium]|nr:vitamin B12-dependent ribonucleotide reductase [Candidatus Microgenomates bacterium]
MPYAKKNEIPLKRHFTDKTPKNPYKGIKWVKRDAVVGSKEKKVFEQKDVEFPDFWSDNAINITASKYLRGRLGTPAREKSARQMIDRVVKTIGSWGEKHGYFETPTREIFEDELTHLLIYQKAAFNSPVWFNVGISEHPQCSACFILSVEDTMPSILDWIKTEGMIFKGGSGSGINLSTLRSKRETMTAGGRSSGPVSFMRGADAVAGMIKSGGATRRAAKMVIMNIDHPDIMEFIRCKADEEQKIRALTDAGYDMSDLNNEAWSSIQFQNANNSVRITDDFMKAVESEGVWQTKFIKTGEVADEYNARELLKEIAQAAWECGDPGVQFDTIINDWHTCPNTARINASNPCSEYMHIDNSACNLASINFMKFVGKDGEFLLEDYLQAIRVIILAQDILVAGSSYPTELIGANARSMRQLGLGFANLGAFLMFNGIPYDSDEGRAWAGALTSILSGEAYRYSAQVARRIGAFDRYEENREPMLRVMEKHRAASRDIDLKFLSNKKIAIEATKIWDKVIAEGEKYGFRNAQVTVIAPTGTIAFMMDCDTTGIEPDYSLVKMKQLVGGGWLKIVNKSVDSALHRLGYKELEIKDIIDYIEENGTIEGAPHFKDRHLPIFDCAAKPANGKRLISWQGHIRLVGAVQPFVSGAISKTFNMANETTVEEIYDAYMMAWKLGVKAFAVYRDGSKATQPLSSSSAKKKKESSQLGLGLTTTTSRRKLPSTRVSETHRFSLADHKGYITYSMFEDGALAEIFIRMAKQGSTLSGLLDAFAISVSMALQYGVPLKGLVKQFVYSRFEPSGFTDNSNIRIATSIVDYIFRYLGLRFLKPEELAEFGMSAIDNVEMLEKKETETKNEAVADISSEIMNVEEPQKKINSSVSSGIACQKCGGIMVRSGTCMTCLQCGEASGGCS